MLSAVIQTSLLYKLTLPSGFYTQTPNIINKDYRLIPNIANTVGNKYGILPDPSPKIGPIIGI